MKRSIEKYLSVETTRIVVTPVHALTIIALVFSITVFAVQWYTSIESEMVLLRAEYQHLREFCPELSRQR